MSPCICRKIRCDGKSCKVLGFWVYLNKAYVYVASIQLYIRRIRIKKKYIHQKVESVLKLVGKMASH